MRAKLDKKKYEKGVTITDEDMDKLNIEYESVNPQWNYTTKPRKRAKHKTKEAEK